MTEQVIGTVSDMWRYPVKSMQGERIDASEVTRRGLTGDRAYALVDAATGNLVSAKRPRQWGGLMLHSAALVDPSADPPTVRITLADGSEQVTGADGRAAEALSRALGRPVRLVASVPQGAVMEEIWPDEKGDSLYGPVVGTEDELPLIGVAPSLAGPPGTLFDFSAIHLVTSASLSSVAAQLPDGEADVRRFRPNLVVDTLDPLDEGFPENGWVGRSIRVGGAVIEGVMLTMRCVMVTLAQPGLPADRGVLRATTANRVEVPGVGTYPCLGLYARVTGEGEVRVGDEVALLQV